MSRRIVACYAATLLCIAAISLGAGRSDVADAVMKGDKAAVRTLVSQKADVNAAQIDGTTALHWAVHRNDVESFDLLIGAGANVKAVNREGITPLYLASLYGQTPMVDKLLKAGGDAKQLAPNGETMLMLAARNGNPEVIRLLIAAGADVNAKEKIRGTTALMWAAEQSHPAALKALLDGGADFKAQSGPAGLPKNYFTNRVNVANVEAAQKRRAAQAAGRPPESAPPADDDAAGPVAGLVGEGGGGLTALIFAARQGDMESAKLLIEAGADVNQVTEYGWTPLLTATQNRHYKLGLFLIEKGADVNLANKGSWTPLYLATDNRNIEGGDYPTPKPDMDHLEFIKILLDHGAKPNARIKDNTMTRTIFTMQWFQEAGATPFARASQSSDLPLMKLLLTYGADPGMRTDFGDTALAAAAGIGWVDGVTFEWSREANLEAVKMLLDLGIDPNTADEDGRTPLMAAALKGRSEIVQLLVDRGARLETRDRGSRDTDKLGSKLAGHTWQALDYADGLVRTGVQAAVNHPETAALIRKLMTERGFPVPPPNRVVDSICIVEICQGLPQ
jgi:ankyrin